MRIVIAPDSFKESLPAAAVARAIADGVRTVLPEAELDTLPLADGGEGTADALVAASGGHFVASEVTGPRGERLRASYGVLGAGRAAVIEMASASGLELVPPTARNPLATTSYGTGELIRAALDAGLDSIIIAIGGSATVDGGAGLVQALGAVFRRADGTTIAEPMTGALLAEVAGVDVSGLHRGLRRADLRVACDVDNPLLGAQGAAAVFGPQKGASAAQVAELDAALERFYDVVEAALGCAVRARPGAGAAGGAGAALLAFLGATLQPGVTLVMDALDLETRLRGATLVITGEGRLDAQTLHGKAPSGVARTARALGVPVVAIGGAIAAEAEQALAAHFDAIEACVTQPQSLEQALLEAPAALQRAGARVARWLQLAPRLRE